MPRSWSLCVDMRNDHFMVISHDHYAGTMATVRAIYIPFDKDSGVPYYQQIYRGLLAAILDGRVETHQRLPSTRSLALELGISRLPVLYAYEQLLHEGYLTGRVGAGTFVASLGAARRDRTLSRSGTGRPRPPQMEPAPESRDGDHDRALAPLRVGLPALDIFPRTTWARLVARHARRLSPQLMAYGGPAGYAPLRATIASYLRAARGLNCDATQVVIVAGSQMALRLCASALLRRGDVVGMEDPGYPGARIALGDTGATVRGVPVDDGGLSVDALSRFRSRLRLVYITPSHQYPLGMAMTAARRLALLEWARRQDVWLVEDDYDSEYRFASRPLGALQGMDDSERVIYVGTFSKVMFPSLRLGYVVVPRPLLARFLEARDAFDLFSPTLYQAALTDFIEEGHFARHVRRMRAVYTKRRDALVSALDRHLRGRLQIVNTEAGMHLCVRLGPGLNDVAVAEAAAAHGLSPIALSTCYLEADARPGLVLGFGGSSEPQLDRAVAVLSKVLSSLPARSTRATTAARERKGTPRQGSRRRRE